jgi:hypothetical protein
MRTGSSGSGFLVTTRTVAGFDRLTDSMVAKPAVTTGLARHQVPLDGGLARRPRSCAPSWNFTPGRSVNSQVVSLSAFQEVASPGCSCKAVSHRVSES